MRQKLLIFLAMIFLAALLVGLNAVSYVQKETKPDSEYYPNRSTYHAGATGARALYDLLAETGRKPMRWRETPAALLSATTNKPQTFVVIGNLRRDYTSEEVEQLLRWVERGGKLVVIDRTPRADLIKTTANWRVSAVPSSNLPFNVDPSDHQQMTDKTSAAKSLLPTVYTRGVNAVQPSRLASSVKLESLAADKTAKINGIAEQTTPEHDEEHYEMDEPPPPAPKPTANKSGSHSSDESSKKDEVYTVSKPPPVAIGTSEPPSKSVVQHAPVLHIASGDKNLLIDFPYGSGQIVFLSDPYIVSNGGISLVDNAQLALNIVAARTDGGAIAFDEYHQGFGANENRLLAYFAGTPIPAILAQLLLLVAVILFTQSRRFARPLPAVEPNRLSKLEYVSAMAELQGRAKAYDLAIENIYTEFRRRAAKSFGVDNYTTARKDLARLIAERIKAQPEDIERLMRRCEDIVQGEATNKREIVDLATRLRETEEKLGLKRTRKEAFKK